MMIHSWVFRLLLISSQLKLCVGFTDYLLKKCHQSGFCTRNIQYSKNIEKSGNSYYSIDELSIEYNNDYHTLKGDIIKYIPNSLIGYKMINLPFSLVVMENSMVRFTVDEIRNVSNSQTYLNPQRYNKTCMWSLGDYSKLGPLNSVRIDKPAIWNRDRIIITDLTTNLVIILHLSNFRIEILYNHSLVLTINDRMFFNFEHLRLQEDNLENMLPEEVSLYSFRDEFLDSRADTLPFGPESIGLDFTFNNFNNVYGIPEHAEKLRLRDTTNGDPYRLYNVDVFEYNVESTMPMYGSIPLLIANRPGTSVGLFWMNAADTWIDIKYQDNKTKTHWMSESGIIDIILFFQDTPKRITQSYTNLTGKPMLPLLSSIGYHQCRWNYNDEKDVLTVNSEMDKARIPYDFIWLDLEYTHDKKYFTWKPSAFSNPQRMMSTLAQLGRNLVTLIDPHLKTDYNISEIIEDHGVAVKNHDGKTFTGQCWPGKSIWIDTFNPLAQLIWKKFFLTFAEGASNLYIWNDMNEPSIFSGPETTAPKDLLHYEGFEERSVHNLYGMTVHEATYYALRERYLKENSRPFILTRSFFAGSQRTAGTWTGDNMATWDYLRISIPMCLTNNIAGMPFIGADVAGFSKDPEPELIARWYQAGLWYPFFRGHAHIDTIRREPYLFQEPLKSIVSRSIKLRYALLPTFYTAFHDAHIKGIPIMNPMFYEKPNITQLYDIDDQFYVGEHGILVKPIVTKQATETIVQFPDGIFYDYDTLESIIIESQQQKRITVDLNKIPVFIEGGHIITRRDRYRRSTKLMNNDPYTLLIAPNKEGHSSGSLYIDDGETFNFEKGEYIKLNYDSTLTGIKGKIIHSCDSLSRNLTIEKIIIARNNLIALNTTAIVKQKGMEWKASVITDRYAYTITKPSILIGYDWEIIF